jgi:hypothetical protein
MIAQGYDFPLKFSSLHEFQSRLEALCISLESQGRGQIIKNTVMKKYPTINPRENRAATQQKLDELLLFQDLLRNHEALNDPFCGKALEIADGI